jgi:hypothetical protein
MVDADSLTAPPSEEPALLLDIVWRPFTATGKWPTWQYVQYQLAEQGIEDPLRVFRSFARVSDGYGAVWTDGAGTYPHGGSHVGLSVAGLRNVAEAEPLVSTFIRTLQLFASRYRSLVPDPYNETEIRVTQQDVLELLADRAGDAATKSLIVDAVRLVIEKEPRLGWVGAGYVDVANWNFSVSWNSLYYEDVQNAEDYIGRLYLQLQPPSEAAQPTYTSPFSLCAALDYFLTVWQLTNRERLAVFYRATTLAQLAGDCQSLLDFQARLSAFADTLSKLEPRLPESGVDRDKWKGAKSLERLRIVLEKQLDAEAYWRAAEAVATLRRIVALRNFGQHSGTEHKEAEEFFALGLLYPPTDWETAWEHISTVAAGALDVIREELQALEPAFPSN